MDSSADAVRRRVRTAALGLGLCVALLACGGGSEGNIDTGGGGTAGHSGTAGGDSAAPDAAADATSDGPSMDGKHEGGAGAGQDSGSDAPEDQAISCSASEKLCGKSCVSKNDPLTGCGQPGCDPCQYQHATTICLGDGTCAIGQCELGWGDCDKNKTDGCEVDLDTDASHCGHCAIACAYAHGVATCDAGLCKLASCEPDFADCNGDAKDGCEVSTATDASNCGSCGLACVGINATEKCVQSVCVIDACEPNKGDCDGSASTGCEIDLTINVSHCGQCGHPCVAAHGTPSCVSGACAIGACDAGYGDCDGDPSNGCEIDLLADPGHCGTCPHVCAMPHAIPACSGGLCVIGACHPGFKDCNALAVDGCEIDTQADVSNCGACGAVCSYPHASAACAAGLCVLGACASSFADCDAQASNGCEVDLQSDPSHCGDCAISCSLPHATPTCTSGACQVGTCASQWANCDHQPGNGCEVNVDNDTANCGLCGKVCVLAHATPWCVAGACKLGPCDPGFGDCNAVSTDGCETALLTSLNHCGGCGQACHPPNAIPQCTNGSCTFSSCNAGYANCNSDVSDGCEVNTTNDSLNCGQCGKVCMGAQCVNGSCAPIILASNQNKPWGIAVDAANVYFSNRTSAGSIVQVPIDGGPTTILASNQNDPDCVAIDTGNVYWSNVAGGSVHMVPIGGGPLTVVASGQTPAGVAIANGEIFWTNWNSNGSIMKVPVPGATPIVVATGQNLPHRIAVDGAFAYWTAYGAGAVRRAPVVPGAVTTIASGQSYPIGIAIDANNVYWTNSTAGSIYKAPLAGGTLTSLASGQSNPIGVAIDATHVYWTNSASSGTIRKVPIAGGAVVTLASGQSYPIYLAVDDESVYWTNNGNGTVSKIGK